MPRRELHPHLAARSWACDPCRPRRALARASAPAAERRACHVVSRPAAYDRGAVCASRPSAAGAQRHAGGGCPARRRAVRARTVRHAAREWAAAGPPHARTLCAHCVHFCVHPAYSLRMNSADTRAIHCAHTAYALPMRCSRSCCGSSARGGGSPRRASSARSATALHLALRPSPLPTQCHPGPCGSLSLRA